MTVSPIIQEDVQTIVEQVGNQFARMEDSNILITGGTGFLGGYLLETLVFLNDVVLTKPCHVYATTRDRRKAASRFPHLFRRSDVTLIEEDVRTLSLPPVQWRFMVHAAASSDAQVFLKDPLCTMDTIVAGTRAALTIAANCKVESFVFVSTGVVYGHQPADVSWMTENYLGGPDIRQTRSCYAEAKRYAELLCQVFCETKQVPASIIRLFALLGPYQAWNSTSAVIDFIRQGLAGDTIRIKDAGRTVRSYCYIADAVVALWKLLLNPRPGEVFNFGSDLEAVSFQELAYRIGCCLGKPVRVVEEGAPPTGVLGTRYTPDVTHFYKNEGFRPFTPLDQALTRTIAWMKEQETQNS